MAHRPPAVRIHAPSASTSRLAAPPVLASSSEPRARLQPKASRKGKERADEPPNDSILSNKKMERRRKRKVRAAAAEDSDAGAPRSSADENEYDGDAGEDDDGDDGLAEAGDDELGWGPPDVDDWADPRNLPPCATGKARVRSQLRALEIGTYRSALLDTVNGEMDLGAALLGLEQLRARTRDAEERVRAARGHDKDTRDSRRRRKSATGSSSGTGNDEPVASAARPAHDVAELDGDSDDPTLPTYPHPSSTYLAKFTHWPLHPSSLTSLPSPPSLPDAFATVFATISHRLAPPRPHRNMKQRPRSAYALSAPLYQPPRDVVLPHRARSSSTTSRSPSPSRSSPPPSSSGSSSLFEDSDDLDSSLDDPAPSAELLERVGAIVDGVLDRVADAVPRGPFPPLDYWDAKARKSSEKEAAKERRKRRKRDGRAPVAEGIGDDEGIGWETVLMAVREREDVSTSVADLLQQRLEAIYGPARPDAINLPPLDASTSTRKGRRPHAARRTSAKTTSTAASRTGSRSNSVVVTDMEEEGEGGDYLEATPRPRKRKASVELSRSAKGTGKAAKVTLSRSSRSTTPADQPPSPFATPSLLSTFASPLLDLGFLPELPPIPVDLPPLPPDFEPVVYDPFLAHLDPVEIPEGLRARGESGPPPAVTHL